MIFTTALLTTCLKLLFIPAYYSTDFEVHRNWLAITHSLPIDKWYYEDTSEWTLDYPPLFAWFEYGLSHIAKFFDGNMLDIDRVNYSSERTVLFQRLSVIFTDLVYIYGIYRVCSTLQKSWKRDVVLPILMITNCGLLMVDHIHFQYNGFLYGILLISIAYMMEGRHLMSAFWFAVLLNLKHIYMYIAPAYFIYLLKHQCIRNSLSMKNVFNLNVLKNTAVLGSVVISVFLATYLPFYQHIPQIFSRLFPFKRGLCHAYWAPNVWALYNFADKAALWSVRKLGFETASNKTAAMTGGLVQEFSYAVLPNITPLVTILLTVGLMVPPMVKLFLMPKQPVNFLRCIVVCGLTSFMFGWHVHEKAILMVIIPLSIISVMDQTDAKFFLILSTVGHYSLFPLLFPPSLVIIKALLLFLYTSYSFYSINKMYPENTCKYTLPLLDRKESIYLIGLGGLYLYENVIHVLLGLDKVLPFLPLMLTSVYCAVGVRYCWIRYYMYFLKLNVAQGKHKNKTN